LNVCRNIKVESKVNVLRRVTYYFENSPFYCYESFGEDISSLKKKVDIWRKTTAFCDKSS